MKYGVLLLGSPILAHQDDLSSIGKSKLSKVCFAYLGGYLSKTVCLAWAVSICCLYEPRGMHSSEHISEI